MDRQSLIDAESFTMRWGSGNDDIVVWKILKDTEYVSLHGATFILPDTVEYNLNVSEEHLNDPTDFFFKYIFPDITGK
jgi:hypothetical protein